MPSSAIHLGPAPQIERLECRRLFSADLAGTFVDIPASLSPVGRNHVTVRIVNQGDAPLNGPVSVTLYASTDGLLDSSDTPLAAVSHRVRLQPGHAQRVAIQFSTPATLPDGSDYLLGKIDGGAAATGNVFTSAHPLTVKQPFVDLVTEFVYLPGGPIRTNGITSTQPWVGLRVVNIGNAFARGTVNLSLYMAPGAVLDGSAAQAAQWKPVHIQLKPGGSRLFAARVTLPSGTLPGSYTLFGVATPTGGITPRHPADMVAAAAGQLAVASTVPTDVLLGNCRRHHRDCTFYDGSDYAADTSASYGFDDVVVQGESIPPGFAPPSDLGPTTEPSSQPSSQPSSDAGLQDAMAAVAAQQSAAGTGNTDTPSDGSGINTGGDSSSSSDGGNSSGDSGGGDGGGDD